MIFRMYTGLSLLLAAGLADKDVSYHHGNITVTKQEAISSCWELPGAETETNSLINYMKGNNISSAWLRIFRKDLGQWTWTNNSTRDGQLPGGSAERACAGVSSVERVLRPMRCNYGGEHEGVICKHDEPCQNTRSFQHNNVTFTYKCDVANWFAARDHCRDNNGTIAIMDTQEKIRKFSENKQRNPGLALCNFFWVGLRRADWYNDKGQLAMRTLWRRGEPTAGLNCSVVQLNHAKSPSWRAVSCNDKYIALCTTEKRPLMSEPFTEDRIYSESQEERKAIITSTEKGFKSAYTSSTVGMVQDPHLSVHFSETTWFIVTVALVITVVILIISIVIIKCTLKKCRSERSNTKEKAGDDLGVGLPLIAVPTAMIDSDSHLTKKSHVETNKEYKNNHEEDIGDKTKVSRECTPDRVVRDNHSQENNPTKAETLSKMSNIHGQDTKNPEDVNKAMSDNTGIGTLVPRNTREIKITERKIKVALVSPWWSTTQEDHIYSNIKLNVNETICKKKESQPLEENITEYLCTTLSNAMPKHTDEENNNIVIILEHIIVPKQEVDGEIMEKIIDIVKRSETEVTYLNISLPFLKTYSHETEVKLHILGQKCVLITPGIKSQLAQSTITVGSIHSTSRQNTICGGLLDFVAGESNLKPVSFELSGATAAAIATKFLIDEATGVVASTGYMRQALISIAKQTKDYDPFTGFGTLRFPHGGKLKQKGKTALKKIDSGEDERTGETSLSEDIMNTVQQEKQSGQTKDAMFGGLLTMFKDRTDKVVIGVLGSAERIRKIQAANILQTEKSFFCHLLGLRDYYKFDKYFELLTACIYPEKPTTGFDKALEEMQKKARVIIQLENLEGTSSEMISLNKAKRSCVVIAGLETGTHDYAERIFPTADAIAVHVPVAETSVLRPAGGRIDFVEPGRETGPMFADQCYQGPWFTGIVAALIILTTQAIGAQKDQLNALRTTSVMRHVLVEMCSHPGEHLPGEGYGVLNPWPFLKKVGLLKKIIAKHTDDDQVGRWAGKDI